MYQGKYVNPAPVRKSSARRRRKKRTSTGTILFYSIYGVLTVVAIVAILCAMPALRSWLIRFEASQPNHKRDEVFAQLFEKPDWKQLYTMAGIADTTFDNSDTFAAYMEQKVGDQKLNWLETSAGLSGDKKYVVKLGEEKIACFTLTGGAASQTDIPQWELGRVELFFTKCQGVTVERYPGQTVYVNGVALDDSYTIRKVSTLAENYLPEGITGYRSELQQVTGLLNQPDLQVVNADGSNAQLIYDESSKVYFQPDPTFESDAEAQALALNAVKTYAQYMIKRASLSDVQKCFLTGSKIYSTIVASEVGWMQSFSSFAFTEPEFVDYYRYSDDLFSIGVNMTLNVTRNNGSIKEYDLNNQLVFQKNANGKYMVYEMTNVEIQQRHVEVRVTFMNGENVISSDFVDASANSLNMPSVDGLTAWVLEETDAKGNVTLTVKYGPNSTVYLPDDALLEPMTLHAFFDPVEEG